MKYWTQFVVRGTATLMTLLVADSAQSDHTTRPRERCGIPVRNYQYRTHSQPAMAMSRRVAELSKANPAVDFATGGGTTNGQSSEGHGLLLNPGDYLSHVPAYPSPTPYYPLGCDTGEHAQGEPAQISLYQLSTPLLAIDHCSISRVALQLHSNGNWVLSLRADQNPVTDDGIGLAGAQRSNLVTQHIRRNLFSIQLRCYGEYSVEESQTEKTVGRPVMVQFNVPPFWVENGEPRAVFVPGCDPRLEAVYDYIERVEIEFVYR